MNSHSDRTSLEQTVCELIARACNFENAVVSPSDSVHDLDMDCSVLLSDIEATYEVKLGTSLADLRRTPFVRDLIDVVGQLVRR